MEELEDELQATKDQLMRLERLMYENAARLYIIIIHGSVASRMKAFSVLLFSGFYKLD